MFEAVLLVLSGEPRNRRATNFTDEKEGPLFLLVPWAKWPCVGFRVAPPPDYVVGSVLRLGLGLALVLNVSATQVVTATACQETKNKFFRIAF